MTKSGNEENVFEIIIKLFILLLIIAWCLMIMYPFVSVVLWSLILAMAFYPLHTSLSRNLGKRPKLASFIIVFTILVIIFVPTWFLVRSLVEEVKDLKLSFDSGSLSIPPPTDKVKEWPLIGEKVYELWQNASVNLGQTIVKYSEHLAGVGTKLAKGILSTAGGFLQIMISLIIAGILLNIGGAGEGLRKFFRKIAGNRGDEFADMTMITVNNVVKGVLGVALILALINGTLFMLAGIPYAGIFTLLIFIIGLLQIPAIIVSLPLIIYMFATKETAPAIIWSVLFLLGGAADNVLKPVLLGKGSPVPMLVIFIGVIGGFMLSGFIGLFTGAIVMSIGYKLFDQWMNSSPETE
jgi:predicted PurR-regulated permease PerM